MKREIVFKAADHTCIVDDWYSKQDIDVIKEILEYWYQRPVDAEINNLYPIICSWCNKVIYYASVNGSHGICQKCSDDMIESYKPY